MAQTQLERLLISQLQKLSAQQETQVKVLSAQIEQLSKLSTRQSEQIEALSQHVEQLNIRLSILSED